MSYRTGTRRRPPGRFELLEPRYLLAAELLGLGHGLAAAYYTDPLMANLAATRIDGQVDFDWGAGSPVAALPADGFAVRWTGKIQAQFSENYTFYAQSAVDDGVRLTLHMTDLNNVNGVKANTLIDTWASHTAAEQSGSLALVAGETYDVTLEYTNASGNANLALRWSSVSTLKAAIPNGQLYPTPSLAVSSIGGNWLSSDVGGPTVSGTFTSAGKVFTLAGGGTGIGATTDQFQFAYQVLQGDGVAIVKVNSLVGSNLNADAQVGLMVRDGTASDALYAGLSLTPADGIRFGYRSAVGGAAETLQQSGIAGPYWLKLVRRGPTVNGYVSPDGADDNWTFVGRADLSGFGDAVLLGLAATATGSPAPVTARLTNVTLATDTPVAGGLGHLTSYYPNLPFIDLVKGGCGPALRLEANGTLSATNAMATLDANGWPTEDFGYRGPYAQKPDGFAGRDCTLTFSGIATVSIVSPSVGTTTPASAATGDPDYTAGYNPATNSSKWYLRTTDLSGDNGTGVSARFQNTRRTAASLTNTGVTNVELLLPGYTVDDAQQVFTQEWLELIAPLTEIRLKDWAMVDGNLTADWGQRTLPSTPNQIGFGGFNSPYGGVAWEYLIQLANLTRKDIWLSVPAHATNDYLQKLAQLVRYGSDGVNPYAEPQAAPVFAGLAPDLNVYLEYSNEVWNGTFESNLYARAQAWTAYQSHTTYGPNQVTLDYDGRTWTSSANQDLIYRWLAAHLKQDVVETWAAVFGAEAINTRIRPVLSGWMAYPDRTCEEGLKFLRAAGWSPGDSLYAISVAGYYGYNDLAAAQVTTNAARSSATKEQTLDTFAAAATAPRGGLAWPVSSAIASAYGMKLVAYEAGPSLGTTYAQGAAQMDPAFADVQTSIVNSWFASGAEQYNFSFIFYLNSYGNSQGDFVLGDNPGDRNQPREQSLFDLTMADRTPPVTDGFTALPSGELEARNYITAINSAPYYTVQPYSWQAATTYRYAVRSLVEQDVDLRLSAAAAAPGDRIQLYVNGGWEQTYDYAAAAARDPANNLLYTDTAPHIIHLSAGMNLVDLVLTNTQNAQGAKAALNSLKFTPVGASLANTLPWAYGLPGNLQNTVSITHSISENATTNFAVDIQDLETPATAGQSSPFTATAVSDNPALVPNDAAHLSLSYSTVNNPQARWTLTLRPTDNMTGALNLTVTIADAVGGVRSYKLPINVVPAAPTATSVIATADADGTVTVAWPNNSQVQPTFKIERAPVYSGAAWVPVGLTGPTPAGATTWADRPPAGGSYYYRITAIDAQGVVGNTATANPIGTTYTYSPVPVPAQSPGGLGFGATNLLSGKTYFVSGTDTTSSGGGQTVYSAFDGTSQYFAFNATANNAMAVTGLDGATAIDTLEFYFPAGVSGQRIPAVSIYYSPNDYAASGQATALAATNYNRLGTSSYSLYQANVAPVTTQPDGVQVSILGGLAIPADTRSLLLRFDTSAASPYLAEVQAFAAPGTAVPSDVSYIAAWQQFSPSTFANYVGATVTLSWTNPNSATAAATFVVQRDTTSAFNTSSLRTWYTNLNATGFLNDRDDQNKALNPYAPTWDTTNRNTPLPAGTTYFYRVGTRMPDGSVVYGSAMSIATPAASYPLDAPTGLTTAAVSSCAIDLRWDPVAGATGYKIERSTRSDFRDTNYAMATVTGTNYSDPTVTPNSAWYYRVRAAGTAGDSAWTTASATAQAITAAPGGLTAEADDGTIRLAWARPTGKIYAYELYRGTSAATLAPYRTFAVGTAAIILPEFLDVGLAEGAIYHYAVRGVFWGGNTYPSQLQYTSFSATATAATLAASTGNLDADGNGTADALTDGILILRYLFDPAGQWSVADALGTGATRTERETIRSYLGTARTTVLDADGNGAADALTDGILILRYLFDPEGAWSYSDALGSGAARTTRPAIKLYLEAYDLPAAPTASLLAVAETADVQLPPPQEPSAAPTDSSVDSPTQTIAASESIIQTETERSAVASFADAVAVAFSDVTVQPLYAEGSFPDRPSAVDIALRQWDGNSSGDDVAARQTPIRLRFTDSGMADDGADDSGWHEDGQNIHSLITVPSPRHRRIHSNSTVVGARLASMRSCRTVSPVVKLT